MKYFKTILAIGLLIGIGTQHACNSDKLVEPMPDADCVNYDATYDGEIKAIVDVACAFSGCHIVGGTGPGNFSTYEGMSTYFNDSGIREFVVMLRYDPQNGMPPNRDTNEGPQDLTDEEFKIMECWINAGYPEN